MLYVPQSGSPVNLNEYITNLQNRIAELEAENAALDERVTILENASIDWKKILADHVAAGEEMGLSPILINKVFEAIHQASIERQGHIMENDEESL